jgi:hypothetical protein
VAGGDWLEWNLGRWRAARLGPVTGVCQDPNP